MTDPRKYPLVNAISFSGERRRDRRRISSIDKKKLIAPYLGRGGS
jgi:hypothetical protein